jgi:hypothetical protein
MLAIPAIYPAKVLFRLRNSFNQQIERTLSGNRATRHVKLWAGLEYNRRQQSLIYRTLVMQTCVNEKI